MKKIYKYATGDIIPDGAIYLSTVKQTKINVGTITKYADCWYVWHYFLVEVKDED